MKRIVWLFMGAMALSLAISCNKDDEKKLVGGEDVTDSFLKPGGKLMDHGVNIVGAWANVRNENNATTDSFFIIDSKGTVKFYRVRDTYGWSLARTLDRNGIFHCSLQDFKYDYTFYKYITSFFDYIYFATKIHEEEDAYVVEKEDDKIIVKNSDRTLIGTVTKKDIDTFILECKDDINGTFFKYYKRVKGFTN